MGLRVSGLFALQWGDFDFLECRVRICRAIVDDHVGDVKTERSEAPLPLAKPVIDAALSLYAQANLKGEDEWVFASPYKGGKFLLDSSKMQMKWLVPARSAIGLDFILAGTHFDTGIRCCSSEPESISPSSAT